MDKFPKRKQIRLKEYDYSKAGYYFVTICTYLLSDIIRGFKTFSANSINKTILSPNKFKWQRSFHDHIIRNDKSLNNIREYIINNPLKWADDENNIDNYKVTRQVCLTPTGQF